MTYTRFDPQLLQFFQIHAIAFDYHEHIPVFTVEESEAVKHLIPWKHSKNLFLSDKKWHYYLVTIEAHKRFPVNLLRKNIWVKELSFGSAEELFAHLHLTPGSVSLFGLMYASPEHISLFIDHDLREADLVGRHPNRNDATLTIDHQNLQKFLTATWFAPTILRFDDTHLECIQSEFTS